MLQAGAILQDRYSIERVIGSGGMGVVYLARQVRLGGRPVAIKEMSITIEDAVERQKAIAQFHKEAEICASISHPGLVDVKDYFEESGAQYLVMDYVDGQTLADVVAARAEFLPLSYVMGWMTQVCVVLRYLHSHHPPVIVRDLKPSNIMLESSGRIRIIDFGIAREFAQESQTSTYIKGAGTPGFAPPEQYGGRTDARSDIFALGATMYAVLTRRVPPISVLLATGEEVLAPPDAVNPEVPSWLSAAILKMMAPRKEDRYPSMDEVFQALRLGAAPAPASPTPAAAPASRVRVDTPRPRFCGECGSTLAPPTMNCPRCAGTDPSTQIPTSLPSKPDTGAPAPPAWNPATPKPWQPAAPPGAWTPLVAKPATDRPTAPPSDSSTGKPVMGNPATDKAPEPAPAWQSRPGFGWTPLPPTQPAPVASPPPARPRKSMWLQKALIVVGILMIVHALRNLMHGSAGEPRRTPPPPPPRPAVSTPVQESIPAGTIEYDDPGGDFKLTYPSGWMVPSPDDGTPPYARFMVVAPDRDGGVQVDVFANCNSAFNAQSEIKAFAQRNGASTEFRYVGPTPLPGGRFEEYSGYMMISNTSKAVSSYFLTEGSTTLRLALWTTSDPKKYVTSFTQMLHFFKPGI